MRYPIRGQCYPTTIVTVYDQDTVNPSTIYAAASGGAPLAGGQVSAASDGSVVFYVDADTYPILSLFDVHCETPGYANVDIEDVWNFFSILSSGTLPATPGLPYSFSSMRTRLATWYRLDATDSQVTEVLNECIQTAYEKTVNIINLHSRQKEILEPSVVGQREYTVNGLGIPTYVGYKTKELDYVPREILQKITENWDSALDLNDPLYYSLYGFDGEKKTVIVWPTAKEVSNLIFLCLQIPAPLSDDNDYPLVPPEWMWIVLERSKIERLRFEARKDEYAVQLQEHTAMLKIMMQRVYPATPNKKVGMTISPEQSNYQASRMNR